MKRSRVYKERQRSENFSLFKTYRDGVNHFLDCTWCHHDDR